MSKTTKEQLLEDLLREQRETPGSLNDVLEALSKAGFLPGAQSDSIFVSKFVAEAFDSFNEEGEAQVVLSKHSPNT